MEEQTLRNGPQLFVHLVPIDQQLPKSLAYILKNNSPKIQIKKRNSPNSSSVIIKQEAVENEVEYHEHPLSDYESACSSSATKEDRSKEQTTLTNNAISAKLLNLKFRTNPCLQQLLRELTVLKKSYNAIDESMVEKEVAAIRTKNELPLKPFPEGDDLETDLNHVLHDLGGQKNEEGPVIAWSWKVVEPEELISQPETLPETSSSASEELFQSNIPSGTPGNNFGNGNFDKVTQINSNLEPRHTLLTINGVDVEVDSAIPECPLCAEILNSVQQLKEHIEFYHQRRVSLKAPKKQSPPLILPNNDLVFKEIACENVVSSEVSVKEKFSLQNYCNSEKLSSVNGFNLSGKKRTLEGERTDECVKRNYSLERSNNVIEISSDSD